jgi:hypothetical protein
VTNVDGTIDAYERLADALDALPAGFTRTPSRLEIKLIKLVFTPEEASLAGQLSRTPETAAEIAKRIGLPGDEVTVFGVPWTPSPMMRMTRRRWNVPSASVVACA